MSRLSADDALRALDRWLKGRVAMNAQTAHAQRNVSLLYAEALLSDARRAAYQACRDELRGLARQEPGDLVEVEVAREQTRLANRCGQLSAREPVLAARGAELAVVASAVRALAERCNYCVGTGKKEDCGGGQFDCPWCDGKGERPDHVHKPEGGK